MFRVRAGQGLFSRMMGAGTGEGVAVELCGYDFDVAAGLAQEVSKAMESVKGITDVKLSRDLGVPEDRISIDRDKADDLGVPVRDIADALRTILAGSEAGEFREAGDEYTILVKVKDADLLSLDQILDLSMRNEQGELIVLRNLVKYERVLGLLPLALGLGDGGETQAPMARAVIGGLSSSTLITLFFIPAAYSVAESMFGAGRKSGKPELLPEENKSVQL